MNNQVSNRKAIDVRDYIISHYTMYTGDDCFLEPPTDRTKRLWEKVTEYLTKERENNGMLAVDTSTVSDIDAYKEGYIDKELELIVGLQTDQPLKRAIMPYGGIRLVQKSLESYGYHMDSTVSKIFQYRKTHNDGVFDVYTEEMRTARHHGIITGLPDAYGRGRIIGDYRRVPLYGTSYLITQKELSYKGQNPQVMDESTIRAREELMEQIRSLKKLEKMADGYGYDIRKPATDTREAIQWLYFAYLAAVKEQNGAAMSLGRVSTFLDIYAEKDLESGRYTESEIQELVDQFVIKLRLIRFLRTPEYDKLFSGDPTWVTESIGGCTGDGKPMVTKMSFRFIQTLVNLGPAPEPNLTVLYSEKLPSTFRDFCSKISIATSSLQYESDDLMRKKYGDDYAIACCVSAMKVGKQMQFFGARVNLAKALLYAINGGRDEISGEQVSPPFEPIHGDRLSYEELKSKFERVCDWLAGLYINTLNVIHYMHDKYCYEKLQMALHDDDVQRKCACGIAGLSVVVDSLSAVKHADVEIIRNENGLAIDYQINGDFPKFGNHDQCVDEMASWVLTMFMEKLRQHPTYRNSVPTLSVLTITSNVVYGKKTGSTPDGRKKGEPFAPGANPMHGRDEKGSIASMASVASLPYDDAEDGISYTFTIVPETLGKTPNDRTSHLTDLLTGYFDEGGHHINVNVLHRELLEDAMEHPENYPQLTIRVSGYAVHFIKLTREQQLEVIHRTFHNRL